MNADARDELERLREQLHQALHSVRLAPGSEAATVRTAHRRRWLRRGLASAGAVALLAGGITAIALRDSSEPGGLATRVESPDDSTGTAEADREVAPAAPTTMPAAPAPTTAVELFAIENAATPAGATPAAVDYPSAVAVDPLLAWSQVTPGPGLEPPAAWTGSVPGVVIGTGGADWAAYYSAEGVAFEPLDVTPPSGAVVPPATDGDAIYSVGVQPAAAADRLVVDISTDRGATWSSAMLPVDTAPPFESEHVVISSDTELTTTAAGAVLLVTERVEFDPSGLPELAGASATLTEQDGVIVFDECGTSSPSEPSTTATPCEPRTITWEQLGLSGDEMAALRRGVTTRAFALDGDVGAELALPPDTATMGVVDAGLFRRSVEVPDGPPVDDLSLWQLTVDGAWQEIEVAPDLAPFGAVPHTVGPATIVLGANADSTMPVFASSTGTGWAYATTEGLFGEHAMPFAAGTVTTGELFAAAISARTDLIAAEGGVEIEAGGVIVRREGGVEDWLVLAADDRAEIAGAVIDWDRSEGGIAVRDQAGAVLAEFDAAAIEPLLDPASPPSWSIATTADGSNVAVESVAELLGVADDEITDVRLNAAGDNVIATVSLADDTSRVLLGTPTG